MTVAYDLSACDAAYVALAVAEAVRGNGYARATILQHRPCGRGRLLQT